MKKKIKKEEKVNHLCEMTPEELEAHCAVLSDNRFIEADQRALCMKELTRRLIEVTGEYESLLMEVSGPDY